MFNYTTIVAMVAVVVSLFAFIYALANSNKKRGTFHSFVTLGFFGIAIGYIYIYLLEFVGESGMVFSLGSLGIISGYLSISFACFSFEKVDKCEIDNVRRYKHIALCIPAVFVAVWVYLLLNHLGFEKMVVPTLLLLSAMPCAYRCFTLIVTPYPKNSFVKCMKPFFIATFISALFSMLCEITWVFEDTALGLVISLTTLNIICIGYIVMPIMLERGYKKWTRM